MSEIATTWHDFLILLGKLLAALLLGGIVGFERQVRQRNAGLRTMVLVAVGAAAFVHLGWRIFGGEGETRIIAYVVSGIGFLGAGVIMKDGPQIRGLNTAATLWTSAAIGAFCGAGLIAESAAVTIVVLAGNTMLRPLVNFINRQPVNAGYTEAFYRVHVVCAAEYVTDARDLLAERLEAINYPIQSIDVVTDSDESIELAATLIPNTADADALDAVCAALGQAPGIEGATWTVSPTL